jgi:hypothetical protein
LDNGRDRNKEKPTSWGRKPAAQSLSRRKSILLVSQIKAGDVDSGETLESNQSGTKKHQKPFRCVNKKCTRTKIMKKNE